MNNFDDDDDNDPRLQIHRVHIPSAFCETVVSMEAASLKRKRSDDIAQSKGVAYFDAVMSSFFPPLVNQGQAALS